MKWVVKRPENIVSFLQKGLPHPPSGKGMRKVLEANFCRVNGRIERFGSVVLKKGDQVELTSGWEELFTSSPTSLKILQETDQALVIDKPDGWVCSEANCAKTFGKGIFLVHRLDKGTTGVLLLAKGLKARDHWMQLFAEREVEKEYVALVDGHPSQSQGICESYLTKKRILQGQTLWGSAPQGQHAITHWKVLAFGSNVAFLSLRPLTGRTHQIRVHMAEMGCPVLVDRQYAEKFSSSLTARRPLLHAKRLKIGELQVKAPLPQDLCAALATCGIVRFSHGSLLQPDALIEHVVALSHQE